MAFRTNKMPVLQEKSASGSVASFNTALAMPLASCNIAVNAWQEGSGNPYPAGGSAQKWDEEWELGTYSRTTGEPVDSTVQIRSKNSINVVENTNYYVYVGSSVNIAVLFYDANDNFISSPTGFNNRTFLTPSNCAKVRFFCGDSYGATYKNDISINYPTTDTSYHPYSNIRPIHGFSDVNATRTGKNLFDKNAIQTGKWINLQTGAIENQAGYAVTDFIYVKANTRYSWVSGGSSRKWFYDVDKNPISVIGASTNYITPTQDGYVCLTLALNQIDLDTIMFVVGNLPDTYEPYVTPEVKTKQLGEEIVGGSYNSATGDKEKTWTRVLIKDLDIGYSSQNNYFYVLNAKKIGITNLMSDVLKFDNSSVGSMSNYSLKGNGNNCHIYIKATDYNTVEALKEALGDYHIAYELIEPIETNIGSMPIETNIGNNNIFCDTGDTSVVYKDLDIAKRGNFREVFKLPS